MRTWTIAAWAGLAGCGGDKTTPTDTTTPTETDADTDADADTDTDADADSDSGTTPSGPGATGVWTGTCLPPSTTTTLSPIPIESFDFEMNLTDSGGAVTGNGRVTVYLGEGTWTETGTTTWATTGWTTSTTVVTWTGYTTYGGSGNPYYYTGYGSYGYGYTPPTQTTTNIGLDGTFDGSHIQLKVDVGSGADNPRLDGTIVGDSWTGTFSTPTGAFSPFDCAFTR